MAKNVVLKDRDGNELNTSKILFEGKLKIYNNLSNEDLTNNLIQLKECLVNNKDNYTAFLFLIEDNYNDFNIEKTEIGMFDSVALTLMFANSGWQPSHWTKIVIYTSGNIDIAMSNADENNCSIYFNNGVTTIDGEAPLYININKIIGIK